MKKKHLALLLILASYIGRAQNPIVPPGVYAADPSARVWNDGKLYLYCSNDESPDYYCSWELNALLTSDLKTWTLHRNLFRSRGEHDGVPYSDEALYAPDCFYIDGKYHLYYCLAGPSNAEGVATGAGPLGPFTDARKIIGANQIDPAVFRDDDGEIYYYWGQFSGKMAKLRSDGKELDMSTYRDGIITEKDHHFHEGIQLFKLNGMYYLVYTDISRRGMATSIGYSTADSPFGPFTYRGVIVDNYGCDPRTWNNHGSVVEFNGRWYVLYHRATHNCVTMRKACIEEIFFNPDGTIDEVEMTTQGVAGPLDPFVRTDAERACLLSGNVYIERWGEDNEVLTAIRNQNTAAYKYFNFSRTPEIFTARVIPKHGGKIMVYANNLSRPLLATVEVPPGDGKTSITLTVPVNSTDMNVAPVYLRFHGKDDTDLFLLDWFMFE